MLPLRQAETIFPGIELDKRYLKVRHWHPGQCEFALMFKLQNAGYQTQ